MTPFEQDNFNFTAARWVKGMRNELNMSQKEFAKYVDQPEETISNIENTLIDVSPDLLFKIIRKAFPNNSCRYGLVL